jgi:C4-dicarboxylate transporter DctM subunit
MSSILIFIVVLGFLLLFGAPVATSFGLSSVVYILIEQIPVSIVVQRMFSAVDSLTIMCVPLFILAGELMSAGGIAKRLVRVINLIFGNITGGLAIVTIVVSAFFAALTGSAMACSVAIGTIMLPYMLDAGYDRKFSAAIIASAVVLGPIIPPSTALIVYGSVAQVSISKLYQVGIPTGLIIGLGLIIVALIGSHKRGYKGLPKAYGLSEMKDFEHVQPGDKLTSRQIVRIVVDAVPAIIAPVIILGAMFTGIATPTESAVVAVIYSFIVGVGVYREYKIRDVIKVVRRTCKATSTVLWIMCCAGLFGWVLSYSKIPDAIVASLAPVAASAGSWVLLLMVIVIILIMGCFMSTSPIILIVVPLFKDLFVQLGYDLVHWGTVVSVGCCVGMITPPFGNVLFTTMAVTDTKLHELSAASARYVAVMILGLLLIAFIPGLIMWAS